MNRFFTILAAVVLCGWATGLGAAPPPTPDPLQAMRGERIQLKVATGEPDLDAFVYQAAYDQFSTILPLRETEPFTGVLEISFADRTPRAGKEKSGSKGEKSERSAKSEKSWFTGGRKASARQTAGSPFDFQNAAMVALLKRTDGERLWGAEYNYVGGWDMSGWVVHTPEQAASTILKRLKARLVREGLTPRP